MKSSMRVAGAVLATFALFLPLIIANQYFMHLIILAGLESVVVMGFLVQRRVQLLTFCAGTFWGIGAYLSAIFSVMFGVNVWLCILIAGMGTLLIALILGQALVRAGYVTFIMMSLVISEIFVESLGHTLGGWDGITAIPRPTLGSFEFIGKASYYYIVLVLLVFCSLLLWALNRSHIGRAWKAIGESPSLAASVGIHIFRYRMAAYALAAFTAGLSGGVYAHYALSIGPREFDIMRSLYMCIYAAVGGVDFPIAGPIVGTVLMKIIPEVLRMTDEYQPIFFALVIILIALFFREGILGSFRKRFSHFLTDASDQDVAQKPLHG